MQELQKTWFSTMGSLHTQPYSFMKMKISTEGRDRLAYQKLCKSALLLSHLPSGKSSHGYKWRSTHKIKM